MADTQRTRAALLALLADNTTGNITPQNLRDFLVTIMDQDFGNPGDFWTEPRTGPNCTMNDKTVKGWIDYSQLIISACSFGKILYLTASGWGIADASVSTMNQVIGVAANSYAAGESQAQVLRRGVVYDSSLSARFSGNIGKLLYLLNGSTLYGSISITPFTSVRVVGFVELSVWSDVTSGKWRFDAMWGIAGT